MRKMIRRLLEIMAALLVFLLSGIPFSEGNIALGVGVVAFGVIMLVSMIWYDTVGEKKMTAKRRARELEQMKKIFSLEEGELVEVLLTPTDMTFTVRLSLSIQQTMQTRYFAVLKGEEISIIAQIGDVMTKPEKMNIPSTLKYQFTPISNKEE